MKFSYFLLKKLVPGLKSKTQLIDALNLHAFETDDCKGDVIEISIPSNRYSDAASHWGIAKEIAAILNLNFNKEPLIKKIEKLAVNFKKTTKKPKNFRVFIKDKNLCPRYLAQYFENISVKPSPLWLQKILKDCGLKPINNVVDVMNYVMLETGQPLHAFDFDKLEKSSIIVRKAKNNESITSIDGINYKLSSDMLVIADFKKPQAIAGIKGGKEAEITKETKRIIVESANFDSFSIYKTSKKLNLTTDASIRFSHGLSLALPAIGLFRAKELLIDLCKAKAGEIFDSFSKPLSCRVLEFDLEKFNHFIGMNLTLKEAENYLKRLGFKKLNNNKWEIPLLRNDVYKFEDLAEEIIRLYGYNRLKPKAPAIVIKPSESDDFIVLKDEVRKILVNFGLAEVYNYSFSEKGEVELLNPVSESKKFLRVSLLPALLKNIEDNFRFFEEVKIFEVGKVFRKVADEVKEKLFLGIGLGIKKKETFFIIKGIIEEFLKKIGLVNFSVKEAVLEDNFFDNMLQVEINDEIIGYFGRCQSGFSLAEFDLEKILALRKVDYSFKPFSKFPAVLRDISVLVSLDIRVGEIIESIYQLDSGLIKDIDLIDEYFDKRWQNLQSLTFRIVFQAEDHTLTSVEIDNKMKEIIKLLKFKFNAEIR